MIVGKILWWDARDNNGMITTGDGKKYYFDASVVKSFRGEKLKARTLVTFEINGDIRNCLCAKNVRLPTAKALKTLRKKCVDSQQLELLDSGSAA